MIDAILALSEEDKKFQKRLQPIAWSQLHTIPDRKYLIKNLFDAGAMSVIYGASNSGKTFLALDISIHIALGKNWNSRKVMQGAVVYIAAEGGLGIRERLEALRKHLQLEDFPPVYILPLSVDLCGSNGDTDQLIAAIQEIENVVLVVVDTLSRAMAGGNENSSEHMGSFVRNCDRIRKETHSHILIIHHSGKNSAAGARGHSLLEAATDTEIEVKQEKNIISAYVQKQRDGKTGEIFYFSRIAVEIGRDNDGDFVSSCVLSPQNVLAKEPKLSASNKRAYEFLKTCLSDKGIPVSVPKESQPVICVQLDTLRVALKGAELSKSDNLDSQKRAITRAIQSLEGHGLAKTYKEFIWITDKSDKAGQTVIGPNCRPTDKDKTL